MFPFLDGHAQLNPVEWKNSIWRVCFFALKTCGFLKIALNNSQTRRPKLTRRSSRLRPLLWFSPGKHAKGKDVRACSHGSELLMLFLWAFLLFNRGAPRGGNGGSWGQRSIERVPSSTASSRPAVPGAAMERQKKKKADMSSAALRSLYHSLTNRHAATFTSSARLATFSLAIMKEDFSQRSTNLQLKKNIQTLKMRSTRSGSLYPQKHSVIFLEF